MAISKVSYNKTPQAHDDAYQVVTYTGAVTYIVMGNDQGGTSKTMYSVDNGISATLNGGPADLLTQDVVAKATGKSPVEYSMLGAKIWINANGTIGYDASTVTMPPAGTSVVDSFIYAIRLGDGTLSWATVHVVLGNHAAVVTGPVTGSAIEDGPTVALNALANASDDFTTNLGVHYDPSALPAGVTYDATTHSFVLNPANGAYQHLAEGQTTTVTVNYNVWDGYLETAATASWVVTGVNDTATISGANTGDVKEDDTASTGGTLSVSDVDDGQAAFAAVDPDALHGTYGTFTFSDGVWTYELDNDADAVQSLGEGVQVEDTLTVDSADGTGHSTITVTVTGTNDAPIVSGPVDGSATEDGDPSTLDGLANASDKDSGDVLSITGVPDDLPAGVSYDEGTHSFTLDAGDNAYQHLAAGDTTSVTVNYQVTDGIATEDASATWLVTGVNDIATMGGLYTGSVTEDGTLVATGYLTVDDVDTGEDGFESVSGSALHGTYGDFTFDNDSGDWTYTLRNSDPVVQALSTGDSPTDTLTISSSDGSASETITITVNGMNEPIVVNLSTTFQINHGGNESDHQTITGFDSNDGLKMDGPVSYVGFTTSGGNTVVTFMDHGGNHSEQFDVTLVGFTGFDPHQVS